MITGIIKCMPHKFIYEEYGYDRFINHFVVRPNKNDNACFIFSLSGVPRYDVLHFYLLYDGMIRYRANIIKFDGPGTIILPNKILTARAFVWTSGPVIAAPREIPMKGFQGFRYTTHIF